MLLRVLSRDLGGGGELGTRKYRICFRDSTVGDLLCVYSTPGYFVGWRESFSTQLITEGGSAQWASHLEWGSGEDTSGAEVLGS